MSFTAFDIASIANEIFLKSSIFLFIFYLNFFILLIFSLFVFFSTFVHTFLFISPLSSLHFSPIPSFLFSISFISSFFFFFYFWFVTFSSTLDRKFRQDCKWWNPNLFAEDDDRKFRVHGGSKIEALNPLQKPFEEDGPLLLKEPW